MQSVKEDVLLRSEGPAAAPSASIQQPPQPSVAQTTGHGTNQRQVRLTRRERDERTTSHREQIRSRSYQSAREHHHSSSSSRSRHHHRHHAHHSSASRDRSNERTRRPESKSKYNCEYITHPSVALSEMADTISSTKNILKDMLTSVDTHSILAKVDAMEKTVKMFNTRSELPVTNSDVHRLLKYSIDDENDDTDTTFDTMEHLGMVMYVTGSHQKELRALVRNTAEYS